MGFGFEKEFDDILNDNEDEFTYRGEEEFTPEPRKQEPNDEDEEPERKGKKPRKNVKSKGKQKVSPKSKPKSKSSNKGNDNKQFIAKIIVASLLISGGLLFMKFGPLGGETPAAEGGESQVASNEESNDDLPKLSETQGGSSDEDSANPDSSESGEPSVTMEDGEIKPGLSDFEGGDHNTNTGEVTDTGDFLKDINGSQIPKHYEVKKITYETDFVSYVKKRGVTGDGVELLWLDAEYKGNPYVIQVPFKVWKELDETGITVVDMEVLTIDKDLKVISNMQVKDNYKEIMEKGEKAVKKDK